MLGAVDPELTDLTLNNLSGAYFFLTMYPLIPVNCSYRSGPTNVVPKAKQAAQLPLAFWYLRAGSAKNWFIQLYLRNTEK